MPVPMHTVIPLLALLLSGCGALPNRIVLFGPVSGCSGISEEFLLASPDHLGPMTSPPRTSPLHTLTTPRNRRPVPSSPRTAPPHFSAATCHRHPVPSSLCNLTASLHCRSTPSPPPPPLLQVNAGERRRSSSSSAPTRPQGRPVRLALYAWICREGQILEGPCLSLLRFDLGPRRELRTAFCS